jgi:hypothetical protein
MEARKEMRIVECQDFGMRKEFGMYTVDERKAAIIKDCKARHVCGCAFRDGVCIS